MFVGASHDIKSSPPLPFPPWWTLYWLYYYFFSLIYPGYSDVMVWLFLHYHIHSSSAGFSLILSVYTHNINSWSACGSVECLYYPFKKVSLEHMAQQWFVQNLLTQFEQSWWKYACATPVVAAYHHFEICSNNFRGFLTWWFGCFYIITFTALLQVSPWYFQYTHTTSIHDQLVVQWNVYIILLKKSPWNIWLNSDLYKTSWHNLNRVDGNTPVLHR